MKILAGYWIDWFAAGMLGLSTLFSYAHALPEMESLRCNQTLD